MQKSDIEKARRSNEIFHKRVQIIFEDFLKSDPSDPEPGPEEHSLLRAKYLLDQIFSQSARRRIAELTVISLGKYRINQLWGLADATPQDKTIQSLSK